MTTYLILPLPIKAAFAIYEIIVKDNKNLFNDDLSYFTPIPSKAAFAIYEMVVIDKKNLF